MIRVNWETSEEEDEDIDLLECDRASLQLSLLLCYFLNLDLFCFFSWNLTASVKVSSFLILGEFAI